MHNRCTCTLLIKTIINKYVVLIAIFVKKIAFIKLYGEYVFLLVSLIEIYAYFWSALLMKKPLLIIFLVSLSTWAQAGWTYVDVTMQPNGKVTMYEDVDARILSKDGRFAASWLLYDLEKKNQSLAISRCTQLC